MSHFANNLEVARKARKLTQSAVGKAVKRSWRTIYNWEAGLVMPSVDLVEQLAQFLRVRPERLLYESPTDFEASFGGAYAD